MARITIAASREARNAVGSRFIEGAKNTTAKAINNTITSMTWDFGMMVIKCNIIIGL